MSSCAPDTNLASDGKRVAALCMDVDILEIHAALWKQTANILLITLLLGGLFTHLFIVWTDASITRPIERLEHCVTEFARNSRKQRDPDALVLRVPTIHTGNEVESLSNAVERMGENLQSEAAENTAPWERLSVSLGLADYCGQDQGSVESVFARADQRMYRAKRAAHKARRQSMETREGIA